MNYQKNNINKLFNDFYKYVDKIIYDIHENYKLSNELFYCKYKSINGIYIT